MESGECHVLDDGRDIPIIFHLPLSIRATGARDRADERRNGSMEPETQRASRKIDRRFTPADARITLKRRSPQTA
jgi:hypothetical protein